VLSSSEYGVGVCLYAGLTGVWCCWSSLNGTEAGLVASAGPDDNKSWGQWRRPSRSSNRTGPVGRPRELRPHARPTWEDSDRDPEQAVAVALRPPRRRGQSVITDQCGGGIAHRHPVPLCSMLWVQPLAFVLSVCQKLFLHVFARFQLHQFHLCSKTCITRFPSF